MIDHTVSTTFEFTSRAREMSDTMSVLALVRPDDVLEFVYLNGSAPGTTRIVTFVGLRSPASSTPRSPSETLLSGFNAEGQWRMYSVCAMRKLVNISAAFREQDEPGSCKQ